METEERNQKDCKASEPGFFLQWGNRKRLRCVRVKDPRISARLNGGIRRKLGSAMEHHRSGLTVPEKEHHHHHHHQQLNRLTRCWKQQHQLRGFGFFMIFFPHFPTLFLFSGLWLASQRRCDFGLMGCNDVAPLQFSFILFGFKKKNGVLIDGS